MHNRFHAILAAALLIIPLAGLLVGCGGGAKKPVDVSAQVQVLKGTDKDAKMTAFTELGALKEAAVAAIPDLIECLKDTDPEIRRLAAYALGEMGPAAIKAVPALKPLLQDGERQVMMQAVNSIRSIDPKAIGSEMIPNVQN